MIIVIEVWDGQNSEVKARRVLKKFAKIKDLNNYRCRVQRIFANIHNVDTRIYFNYITVDDNKADELMVKLKKNMKSRRNKNAGKHPSYKKRGMSAASILKIRSAGKPRELVKTLRVRITTTQ